MLPTAGPHGLDPHSIPFNPSSLDASLPAVITPVLSHDLILTGTALTAPLPLLTSQSYSPDSPVPLTVQLPALPS